MTCISIIQSHTDQSDLAIQKRLSEHWSGNLSMATSWSKNGGLFCDGRNNRRGVEVGRIFKLLIESRIEKCASVKTALFYCGLRHFAFACAPRPRRYGV